MGLVYCGIDEAGYGPLLGPLCVGAATLLIESWQEGDPAPDLWSLLGGAVCRKPDRGSKGAASTSRIAVDDSKNLKLPNSSTARDPLVHLERGVLTFLRCKPTGPEEEPSEPADDAGLFRCLGIGAAPARWYGGDPICCPRSCSSGAMGISANLLRRELAAASVSVEQMACRLMGEQEFNRVVERAGTKAATTELGIGHHLATVWKQWAMQPSAHTVRVVCDRQSGRTQYGASLVRMLASEGVRVAANVLEESAARSRYELRGKDARGAEARMVVMFMPEAESQHLPVALASMIAKLVRELFMSRFNRFWAVRMPELKPTAGYRQDGWRWLEELGSVASESERVAMIRRA